MAEISYGGSRLGTSLQRLLMADEIEIGSEASYQLCKTIYLYHPLGPKLAELPIQLAQSQPRKISIRKGPEERIRDQYIKTWTQLGIDRHIFNVSRLARIYGVSTVVFGVEGQDLSQPTDMEKIHSQDLYFNVFDPLNTAGSLVLDQNPNSPDFQRVRGISVQGIAYHPSRCMTVMNESPIYIGYTNSAFGYVGRSVYQRPLFPLKSFIQTMRTDDMVARKAGVIIAKLKAAGSIIDNAIKRMAGVKRAILKEAEVDNVINIDPEEDVQSLNLQNLEGPLTAARKNILENIAASEPMPAKLLNSETYAEGFGEGSEDAKDVARYVDRIRLEMDPVYSWFDNIVQRKAWTPAFYKIIQAEFPEEYGDMDFATAFFQWKNNFVAEWPSLLTEPDSEKIKVDDTKFKAVVAALETLLPNMDPENRTALIVWAVDSLNQSKLLFTSPLVLDEEALADFVPPVPGEGQPAEDGVNKTPPPPRMSGA